MVSCIRHILILFGAVITAIGATAQTVDQWTKWGDAAFAKGEFYGASRYYAGALDAEPGRMAIQWKQAEACRLSNQYDKAHVLYDRVYRKDQGRTYPEALRWLGEMLMCDAQYDEAKATWQKVVRKGNEDDAIINLRANNALTGIALAASLDTSKNAEELEHLPEPINSYSSEFAAQIGPDGLLYFTTLRGDVNEEGEVKDTASYKTRILHVASDKSPLKEPIALTDPMNRDGNYANTTWSNDGKYILFTRCTSSGECGIEIATTINGAISESRPLLGLPMNATNTQPMLAIIEGGEYLFFSSDAKGGEGEFDIWSATFSNGEAKEPEPLGAMVNSPGNERTPWFSTEQNTLWYSSDFLPGLGGYDLFHSKKMQNGYETPINAGKPWNSPANDLYPAFVALSGEAFLTSNRKGSLAAKGETCCNDIYRIKSVKVMDPVIADLKPDTTKIITVPGTPEITVAVLHDLQVRFPLKLYFENDQPEPRSWATTTARTYGETHMDYKALLPTYLRFSSNTDATEKFFADEVDLGYSMLNELIKALEPVLNNGEKITLDVRGHASPLARNAYNVNLSQRRIESLRNHLSTVSGGSLASYLDSTASSGGVLRVRVLPFGEDRSVQGVSDDLRDLKNSVYSVDAARERRIEVERIGVEPGSTPTVKKTIRFSIGTVQQGVEKRFAVPIANSGSLPLQVSAARSECDCVQVGTYPEAIAPGSSANLELLYTGRTRPGPLIRSITLMTNGTPQEIELIIDGIVIE